jgi:hypothetical protein
MNIDCVKDVVVYHVYEKYNTQIDFYILVDGNDLKDISSTKISCIISSVYELFCNNNKVTCDLAVLISARLEEAGIHHKIVTGNINTGEMECTCKKDEDEDNKMFSIHKYTFTKKNEEKG